MNIVLLPLLLTLWLITEWGECGIANDSNLEDSDYLNGGRVIGGSSTEIKTYPFIVSIQHYNATGDYWYFRCVGSIISANTILTACHCIRETPLTNDFIKFKESSHVRILAGVSNRYSSKEAQTVVARELVPHPQCKTPPSGSPYNTDVAAIVLNSNLNFTSEVDAVKVFSTDLDVALKEQNRLVDRGALCISMGWGLTEAPPSSKSLDILQFTSLHLIDSKKCAELWCQYNHYYCNEDMNKYHYVCALGDNSTMCRGDSGGPLICNNYLFGVDNLGDNKCRFELPTIFANMEPILYFFNQYNYQHLQ